MKFVDFKALSLKDGDLVLVRKGSMPLAVMEQLAKHFNNRGLKIGLLQVPDPLSDVVVLRPEQREQLLKFLTQQDISLSAKPE